MIHFRLIFLAILIWGSRSVLSVKCPNQLKEGTDCFHPNNTKANCSEILSTGAKIRCARFYEPKSTIENSCGTTGKWSDPEFKCQPICGITKHNSGHRPYAVAIYQLLKKGIKTQVCSGILISVHHVLTTGYCVLDNFDKKLDTQVLEVGIGSSTSEILFEVTNFSYDGPELYSDSIVVLTISNLTLASDRLPVCLQSCAGIESLALRNGSIGEVFGKQHNGHEKLQIRRLPRGSATQKDFCAGNEYHFANPQLGYAGVEVGSGLTIPLGDDLHVLYGILVSTPSPLCGVFQTFKRIYPYVDWILGMIAAPEVIFITEGNAESPNKISAKVTRATNPSTETTSLHINGKFELLDPGKQRTLRKLWIKNTHIDSDILVKSLEHAALLTDLTVENSTLTHEFRNVRNLSSLTNFVLKDFEFESGRIGTPWAYFPFHKGTNWTTGSMIGEFDEIQIDDRISRFIYNSNRKLLIMEEFDLKASQIIKGLNTSWHTIVLNSVQLEPGTVFPRDVKLLHLSNLNFPGTEIGRIFRTTATVEIVTIHNISDGSLDLQVFPTKTLQALRLDRVNVSLILESTSGWFGNSIPTLPAFGAVKLFYWGIEVKLAPIITENFVKIFPNVKLIAYFGEDNSTQVESFLQLNLEMLFIRINLDKTEGKKVSKLLKYEHPIIGTNLAIHLCVEWKKREMTARYLGSAEDLEPINARFGKQFDICFKDSSYAVPI